MRAVAASVGTLKMERNIRLTLADLFRLIDVTWLVSNIQRALYERSIRSEYLGQIFRQPTVRVFIPESDRLWSAGTHGRTDLRNYHLFDGSMT